MIKSVDKNFIFLNRKKSRFGAWCELLSSVPYRFCITPIQNMQNSTKLVSVWVYLVRLPIKISPEPWGEEELRQDDVYTRGEIHDFQAWFLKLQYI